MTRLTAMALALVLAAPLTAAERPNVLIVMTDDQGLGDFSFTGNPVLKTPNLDKFATESVRFSDFHVAPMCSPTRGQLLTGLDALRNGATSVTAGRTFVRPGIPTLPELFAKAGYRTGLFGKWHLGDHYPHRPTDRGFQEAVYHLGWGMLHSTPEFGNPLIGGRYFHNGEPKRFVGHCTDHWFDTATAWMKERHAKKEPFVCYLPTNAPHGPHVELTEFVEPYRNRVGPADFFGMIAHVDRNFGRLDEFLTQSGLRDNTIVVFMTDNGGTAGVPVHNAGLRAGKTTYYDGGHRVPCWVRWPAGKLGQPRDIDVPTQNQDLLPTLLDLCGVKTDAKFDGTSLAGLLRGSQDALPDRMLVVQYGQIIKKWDSCVIWNKWRLVRGEELYDVVADRAQKRNVAGEHPDVRKKMRDHYETWWSGVEPRVNDFVPCAHLGTEQQPEVALNSGDWEGIYADNTGHVRNAVGGPRGGHWHVVVASPGEYEFALRRWPRETKASLESKVEDVMKLPAVGGKNYNPPSKAFAIAAAQLEAGGKTASAKTAPTGQEVTLRLALPAGRTTVKAWFQDHRGEDLCGAFYVYVRRVGPAKDPEPELGRLSEKYESGGRGPGTVSTGRGDPGGVSYGTYQLASKVGRADEFVRRYYPGEFRGLKGGTPEFTARWKQLAARDPVGLHANEHAFIRETHYDPQAEKLKAELGLDVAERSAALRDVVWSTAVQHGPRTDVIVVAVGPLVRKQDEVSDEALIRAIYAERGRKTAAGKLARFPRVAEELIPALTRRFENESQDALRMLKNPALRQ
jgi:arylsulfatase